MNDHERFILENVVRVLRRTERRLAGQRTGFLNSTRNADRMSLAHDSDSIRLEIDNIRDILEEMLNEDIRDNVLVKAHDLNTD